MGYYSVVTVGMKKRLFEKLVEAQAAIEKEELKKYVDFMLGCSTISNQIASDGDEAIIIQFESMKWYYEFPEIHWFMDFLENFDGANWCFIRIGEDWEDLETEGNVSMFPLSLQTTLV